MNTATPRLFVAATRQNDGKTTAALGLFAALKKRLGRIGYIKPVGQRFVEHRGQADRRGRHAHRGFLQRAGAAGGHESHRRRAGLHPALHRAREQRFPRFKRLQNSFDRAAWEKDFVIIEGTGHAGVGSVFDLSNARVAKLLGSKVIIVTGGGIGKPIDEVALNKALFDSEGVEIVGVILNKVLARQARLHLRVRPPGAGAARAWTCWARSRTSACSPTRN